MKVIPSIFSASLLGLCIFPSVAMAEEDYITISGYLGSRLNQDIESKGNSDVAELSSELTEVIAIGWKYDTKAEGELLLSNSKQHLSMSGNSTVELNTYVQYFHLGGKILFTNNSPFSTNIGVGAGITYFNPTNSDYKSKRVLSAHMSAGLRYQISESFALRSDLRVYGNRFHTEKSLFCNDDTCLLNLDNDIYLQAELATGFEFKF